MSWILLGACILLICGGIHASFFEVRYPSVVVAAEIGGNLTLEAGPNGGNVYLMPGAGGTVYIAHTDMLKLFELVNSMPPVWGQKAPFGTLGTFYGTETVSLQLMAMDPEGRSLRFEKVSGALPPGVFLDKSTGLLNGTAPDVNAKYEFGIRVTDEQGKYADQTFTIDTRESNQCTSNPCQNGGTCYDGFGSYTCACALQYGGTTCETVCANAPVGVSDDLRTIPDAQMSGHYAYSGSSLAAYQARLGGSSGWIGHSSSSWLQIDLGSTMYVYAVATQGYSDTYTLDTFKVDCSADGNTFTTVPALNGTDVTFLGSGSSNTTITKQSLPVPQRCHYVRFIPLTWSGSYPGLRVEVYACE